VYPFVAQQQMDLAERIANKTETKSKPVGGVTWHPKSAEVASMGVRWRKSPSG
jgi:hypothetical protein